MGSLSTLEKLGFVEMYVMNFHGTKSSEKFNFDVPLQNVVSIEVNSALIPRAEYTIDVGRDTLTQDVTIAHRDYSAHDLAQELSNTNYIQFSYETVCGKFKVDTPIPNFSDCTMCRVIGFDKKQYSQEDGLVSDGAGWFFAPYRYNLMGSEAIILESNLDSQINHGKMSSHSLPLAKFYVSDAARSQFVQLINYEQPSRHFHPIGKLTKLELNFKRGHDRTQKYNFNGLAYYLQVVVKCISYGKDWGHIEKTQTSDECEYILKHLVSKIEQMTAQTEEKTDTRDDKQSRNLKILAGMLVGSGVAYYAINRSTPIDPF